MFSSQPYLCQKEHKVTHSVDGSHAQGIFHQDDEGVAGRCAEAGAVDGCCGVGVLKSAAVESRLCRRPSPCLSFTHLIQIFKALLKTPQTADAAFQHAASAGVFLAEAAKPQPSDHDKRKRENEFFTKSGQMNSPFL